ncbi:MAG: hypothetical protein HRU11_05430 [Parvularculaceae bacterium]|nr:hypothetical protein [Parvularculaceae bacterium]
MSRKLTDRTHAFSAGWADHSSRANPAQADLRAEGVFLSNDAMTSVRSAFLTGEAEPWALVLPGDGTWAGQFFVRDLQLSGVAESEISFSLRLLSSGPISFQMEI